MLDRPLRRLIDPSLDAAGRGLVRQGVGADQVTVAGLILGLAAAAAAAKAAFGAALVLILVNRLCDGLDGAIARARGRTDAGGFLDITADFVFYGALPLGFALADPAANALPAAALLFAFYVNGAAFLAFAALAAKRPELGGSSGKSFHYLWGLAEGTETVMVFVAMALLPAMFPVLAWGFAALCMVSGVGRIASGYLAIRAQGSSGGN
ncbi:MAG: CDP-alcohol phosphatidyltransferase family protein [Phreatobacter sp.]